MEAIFEAVGEIIFGIAEFIIGKFSKVINKRFPNKGNIIIKILRGILITIIATFSLAISLGILFVIFKIAYSISPKLFD